MYMKRVFFTKIACTHTLVHHALSMRDGQRHSQIGRVLSCVVSPSHGGVAPIVPSLPGSTMPSTVVLFQSV
jgi:hypothetical protein